MSGALLRGVGHGGPLLGRIGAGIGVGHAHLVIGARIVRAPLGVLLRAVAGVAAELHSVAVLRCAVALALAVLLSAGGRTVAALSVGQRAARLLQSRDPRVDPLLAPAEGGR